MNADPVIVALFNRLPAPDTAWPLSERLLWLSAMEGALNLIYGPVDNIPIVTKLTVEEKPYVAFVDNGDGSASEVSLTEGQAAALGISQEIADRVQEIEGKPAPRDPLPVKISAPRKSTRPEGIPSNLEMALAAIDYHDGKASAPQVEAYVRKNFWPDVSAKWTNCLWGFVPGSHLARDGINFVRGDRSRKDLPAQAPKMDPAPAPLPAPAVKPAPRAGVSFEHEGSSVTLPLTGYVYAAKLKAAMGQHIDEAFLAEKVVGSNTAANRDKVKSICLSMNEALSEIGLAIKHYPGFGLKMDPIDRG